MEQTSLSRLDSKLEAFMYLESTLRRVACLLSQRLVSPAGVMLSVQCVCLYHAVFSDACLVKMLALERQDLSCMYLAHDELKSEFMICYH